MPIQGLPDAPRASSLLRDAPGTAKKTNSQANRGSGSSFPAPCNQEPVFEIQPRVTERPRMSRTQFSGRSLFLIMSRALFSAVSLSPLPPYSLSGTLITPRVSMSRYASSARWQTKAVKAQVPILWSKKGQADESLVSTIGSRKTRSPINTSLFLKRLHFSRLLKQVQ